MPVRTVDAPRLTIADVVPSVPAELGSIELGPAPPAGSSRIVNRGEVVAALPGGTADARMIPSATRIVRATSKLSKTEIELLLRAAAKDKLPKGATLVAVRPRVEALVPRGYDDVELVIGRPPRKVGRHATTATMHLRQGGTIVATLLVPIELQLSAAALVPAIRRGSSMMIVVGGPAIEVQAPGKANEDADVGDVLQVTVEGSGKVLRARLVQAAPPRGVVEP